MPRTAIPADLSPRAYRRAADFLAGLDADWARHVAAVGPCRHEAKPGREPYEALVRAIAHQQLHARAAEAILARLLALYPDTDFPSPQALLATDEQQQRACGLSASSWPPSAASRRRPRTAWSRAAPMPCACPTTS